MSIQDELNLRLAILRELDLPGAMTMPEPTLLNRIRCTQPEAPTMVEFSTAVNWLEQSGFMVRIRPELGGPLRCKLTDAGRAELAMRL